MAKQKTVYAPGELAKTRERLGSLDKEEAKRMTELLGGEIGYERTEDQETSLQQRGGRRVRTETVEVNIGDRRTPRRRVDTIDGANGDEDNPPAQKKKRKKSGSKADDPSVTLKVSYWERVRIDKYCGQMDFEIKSSGQIFVSMLSFLADPVDYVSPAFVNRRMNDYYKRIEILVTSVRTLFPRNNLKRNEQLKKASPFAFAVLDTLRYWNIDHISAELSRIQARPRSAKVTDFIDILKNIYRPLYVLEHVELDTHIKGAFKMLYKVLFLENPSEAKKKYQELIRTALFSLGVIRRDIRYQLYPLLMKLLSHCWLPYETFFQERKNRVAAFLQVSERNRINPQMEDVLTEAAAEQMVKESTENGGINQDEFEEGINADDIKQPESEEEKQKKQARETEARALERGLSTLETLFPRAGWDRIQFFPDMYPYFSDVFNLKKGAALFAPTDPLQQVYILIRILEELFFGLRYVNFGVIMGPDGNTERLDEPMARIINGWQRVVEASFDKEYLSRLDEYCHLLENTAESRTSNYAKRLMNELNWARRFYFLPFYRFESIAPPPFQKNSLTAVYPLVRSLRRYLTALAGTIEQGNSRGGAEKKAPCDGIDNPWDPYVFQVPNPVSKRLDMLLSTKGRNNATLVYFTLAVATVLDYLMNDENSWAYSKPMDFLFRSENGNGVRPLFGVESKIDTEMIFRQALKKRQVEAAKSDAEKSVVDAVI